MLEPACEPVIQLVYSYGCKPIRPDSDHGLSSICLSTAEGAAAEELTDPDEYRVVLLQAPAADSAAATDTDGDSADAPAAPDGGSGPGAPAPTGFEWGGDF